MNALERIEIEELEEMELTEEAKERFKITDLDSLNWAFRKIAALNEQKKEAQELAKAEMERIKTWLDGEEKPVNNSISFFEGLIKLYHMEQLDKDPKAKTLKTPYGKSKSTTSKAQPDQQDKEKLLAYVKDSGLTDLIKEEVKWGDLKKTLKVVEIDGKQVVVDGDGQLVEGASVKPADTSYKVEV
ncbi:host-nuclease inhibitor Gam family protein [Halalkalibacter krulwichiae]|uniref:Bacteriophage Mu Gam like protein n=1 Tax=Halalkalibacter krulwichiae TaxID=199441 RepID=A0A1Y9THK7_9BACI|nr:host-nuclease inhibitor Gam family protein [Halalkalibacter krulwichiae]ARK28747.1 Bacteriophage Mu Gam like protein [Halalkalibacter krulwichiae]